MRRLIAWALSLGMVSPAFAAGPKAPDYVTEHQGATFAVDYRALSAATSACAFAPTGTTCTGGVNTTGDVRSVTIQNIGANDAFCDETSPAVASQGLILKSGGGSLTIDKASVGAKLYCISTVGTTIAVIVESR